MKILYVSSGQSADYQCDSLWHGFRALFGTEVVDIQPLAHMYWGADLSHVYGKGFTLFGLVEECTIDRTDIPAKIRNKFFDYVVFGSVRREHSILGEVWQSYPASQIIFINGEDDPEIWGTELVHKGIYFKREMHTPQNKVWPIQFGFPKEKIQPLREKTQLMAPLDPVDSRTYIYEDEQSYYADYGKSLFGKTMRKAGWECMRHLEIMANRCIPWFQNLELCPATIMTRSPKKEMLLAKQMLEYENGRLFLTSAGQYLWEDLERKIFDHFSKYLTTEALATYVLDTAREA